MLSIYIDHALGDPVALIPILLASLILLVIGGIAVTFHMYRFANASVIDKPPIAGPLAKVSSSTELEECQVFLGTALFGAFGLGISVARFANTVKSGRAGSPGFNEAPGSSCFKSGSWSYQAEVTGVATDVCTSLASRALGWKIFHDKSKANPNVVVSEFPNGTLMTNVDGYRQNLTFVLLDENGDRGAAWMGQSACMLAMTTLLYDCSGSHGDTRGGMYFYGHDGVVGYGVDPTCVDSLGKKCGKNI